MKETVTITRHEMAKTCSAALNIMIPDENRSMLEVAKLLFFTGLIMAIMFDEEDEDNETSVCHHR